MVLDRSILGTRRPNFWLFACLESSRSTAGLFPIPFDVRAIIKDTILNRHNKILFTIKYSDK